MITREELIEIIGHHMTTTCGPHYPSKWGLIADDILEIVGEPLPIKMVCTKHDKEMLPWTIKGLQGDSMSYWICPDCEEEDE